MPVPEYRLARSVPERALAMALAAARPGPLRRRFEGLDAVHYPLTIALPPLELPSVGDASTTCSTSTIPSSSRARSGSSGLARTRGRRARPTR